MPLIITLKTASLAAIGASILLAQAGGNRPAFEVATVKLSLPDSSDLYQAAYRKVRAMRGLIVEGNRVTVTDNTLRNLVRIAYQMKDYQVSAPSWMAAQHFDVVGSLPEGSDRARAPEMLRTLLEERFHLACHEESKEMSVLAMVVAKGGFKPAKVEANGNSWFMIRAGTTPVLMKAATMEAFADRLTRYVDRPVVDMTGMEGTYDFDLTFATGDSDAAPPLVTVLQEQMGLRLEPRKTMVKTVVVDRADKLPAEN